MDNPDVNTSGAAPSAAAESPNPFASGKLTKEMSQAWMNGEEIKPKTEVSATSDTQKDAKSEGKPESAPATEAGKGKQENSRRKPGAEARISELTAESKSKDAEIERLRRELAAKTDGKPAETSTAKPVQQPGPLTEPKEPDQKDFKIWEEYEVAHRKWVRDLASYEGKKAVQEAEQRKAVEAHQQQLNQEIAAAKEQYADFDAVIKPVLEAIAPTMKDGKPAPQIHPLVEDRINRSTVFPHLLYVLGGDPKQLAEFVQEARTDPSAAWDRIVILEQLVKEQLKAKSAATEKKDPPAKTKTNEPTPQATREVGTRGTGPDDPAADAVRRSNGKLTKEVSDQWMRRRAQRFQN